MRYTKDEIEKLNIVSNFKDGDDLYMILQGWDDSRNCKYFQVINAYGTPWGGWFTPRDLNHLNCTPFEFAKTEIEYGMFKNAVELKTKENLWKLPEPREYSGYYDHELGVPQDRGAWPEDAGIYGWDLD